MNIPYIPTLITGAAALCLASPAMAQEVSHTTGVNISDTNANSADLFVVDVSALTGRTCIGGSCVDAETFDNATMLKITSTLLNIDFEDTSGNTFPDRDWKLLVNDGGALATGGLERFSIEDVTEGTIPFTVEGGAPENALWINDDGFVGFGTSLPQMELHVVDGATPRIRLEQDASSGETPALWDIFGHDVAFGIQDGSTLAVPFVVHAGAPDFSLGIASSGNVGLGTYNPQGALDISTGADPSSMFFTNNSGSWKFNHNVTTGRFNIARVGANTPFKIEPTAAENLLRLGFGASDRVDINGDLVVSGNCTETDGACADYVFGPDHARLSLPDLRAFIAENRHLPNVPSEADIRENGVNMAHFSGRLLEKVEELTLYTLEQEDVIAMLRNEAARQNVLIEQQADRMAALEEAILETR